MDPLPIPLLPAISWMAQLSPEERARLGSYGSIITLPPEKFLIQEGEPQPYFYFVIKGMLSVRRKSRGQDLIVAVVCGGESLGEMTMVTRGSATASVIGLEDTQLWRIHQEDFMKFIQEEPVTGNKILLSIISLLSDRLIAVKSDLATLLSQRRENFSHEG